MASLVITPSGGSAITFLAPSDSFTGTAGRYWDSYRVSPEEYAVRNIAAPGVDGQARERLGFRTQTIWVRVWYIDSTAQGVNDKYRTDRNAINNVVSQVSIPDDSSYDNCDLLEGSATPSGPPRPNSDAGGMYRMAVEYIFIRKEL